MSATQDSSAQLSKITADDAEEMRLVISAEAWDVNYEAFEYWKIIWTNEKDYFFSTYSLRKLPDDLNSIRSEARLVPRTFYRPHIPSDIALTPAPLPLSESIYIKKPVPLDFELESSASTGCADDLLKEAQTCEQLAKHPHPHICTYHGIIEEDGALVGLCLERHGKTLYMAVIDGDPIDARRILEGVKSGLDHLHALGFVHGDINPTNIVLDATSAPVIIDFDSCTPQGSKIDGKYGTFPWCKDPWPVTAEFDDDIYCLEKIKEWFIEKGMEVTDTDS
ncbi:hypothetical protein EVG20_g5576 [Dentipellis fragilis]|uniref:Protein kinase domain-containing protein n=1 Tax=Dentipellis fragilis TaxID=205917 RepID=A0A4Y9YUP7_9AGAM|nr:hypothetical protein EVG20_g5576 [Dentipellis fragilis]